MNNPDSNLCPKPGSRTVTATGFRVSTFIESGNSWIEEYEAFPVRVKEDPSSAFASEARVIRIQEETLDSVSSNRNPGCVKKRNFLDCSKNPDWYLVGGTALNAVSTTNGINKLLHNETVYFNFNSPDDICFSTKRSGEIGQLPIDCAKWMNPLVCINKVNIVGRCIAAPVSLSIMEEIVLSVSFYIHVSVFTSGDKSPWMLDLFKCLKIEPYQKADSTPGVLDSGKRVFDIEDDDDDDDGEVAVDLPLAKRRKGVPEPRTDGQAISESSLNKIVGCAAADTYSLVEMEPRYTLTCKLRPFQKQGLYWMCEREKGIDVEEAAETLHPSWSEYRICDERASSIYVNVFSGEATFHFPSARQMARGGILADAMGIGKTVMTIALILSRPGKGNPDLRRAMDSRRNRRMKDAYGNTPCIVKGGTLIICPMSLLSQWKDELETHSSPGCLSVLVHYGGKRTDDPKEISKHDVVLTTYGVLSSAYRSGAKISIYHRIDWYRVVLDEAHTIKSSKTEVAQACFALSACCRWCLTGTPIQNKLEDLYSLLCFLRVEPWCHWAWWKLNIQGPCENGNPTGLKWIKAILRLMMLRRTKETEDKEGRPILILPSTDSQIIECEQSEAERDFYDALFRNSKFQFDQFIAQGTVLRNYALILELLLRLRQCCDHPFLVMSRADSEQYMYLNKPASRFLETVTLNQNSPTEEAYIEEVVDCIQSGEYIECPICLESAYDPVFTPCAHRMCRECLLSGWQTPTTGFCPICRVLVNETDIITCPTQNRFRVDFESDWKESSKVSKLLECLEHIRQSGSGEKSIVFSQWTSFLDLLEIPLKRRGIGFLRFDGKLTQKQREGVLKEFNDTGEKMVLLMSLRAGGVGLNLTAASNVFLMDPWWNPAVEEQAITRIHRIGQTRTVTVRRFIVKDTVEERMQQVKARKERMIAGALTEEQLKAARIEELKMLFR